MYITVNTQEKKEVLGDLFGIFFEDINHAADGGLYGELVRNRAFEFNPIDRKRYRALTAWEKVQEGGKVEWMISDSDPVSKKNPHYLFIEIKQEGKRVGIRNQGYNEGMYLQKEHKYRFSCYARSVGDSTLCLRAALTAENGYELEGKDFEIGSQWEKYELLLKSSETVKNGRLEVLVHGTGKVELDFISLFPEDTYLGRENGMRRDIAETLAALKPKFMRFPGGSLIHDGTFNPDDRDSMYRWKNTLGDIVQRPSCRNTWSYNQTLGLGYYEYFLFCEDIGAKPLPVLPAGHNPCQAGAQSVPIDRLQPWIDDALDLIEFANGAPDTKWGAVRTQMGHVLPFGLEYLAIGNEEVEDAFFEQYAVIHKAVKEKYPEIKLINTAGMFCDGDVHEKGWKSAKENGSALVDEHYYQAPEWFMANFHRYDRYDGEVKAFIGEYASKGNTWHNALAEASYMIGLEKNAHSVGMACYAPLLCNVDYVNWKPNLIYFDNHQVCCTPSYYVQKLFMNHQGKYRLDCISQEMIDGLPIKGANKGFKGKLCLTGYRGKAEFSEVIMSNLETGERIMLPDLKTDKDCGRQEVADVSWEAYSLKFKARQPETGWGFDIFFGMQDSDNYYVANIGGWGNQDALLTEVINGLDITYTQRRYHVEAFKTYEVELRVEDSVIDVLVDNRTILHHKYQPLYMEQLYYTASKDENGDVIIKLANTTDSSRKVEVCLDGINYCTGRDYIMEGELDEMNSFENPDCIKPLEKDVIVVDGKLEIQVEKQSFHVIRLSLRNDL